MDFQGACNAGKPLFLCVFPSMRTDTNRIRRIRFNFLPCQSHQRFDAIFDRSFPLFLRNSFDRIETRYREDFSLFPSFFLSILPFFPFLLKIFFPRSFNLSSKRGTANSNSDFLSSDGRLRLFVTRYKEFSWHSRRKQFTLKAANSITERNVLGKIMTFSSP